MKKLSRRHFLRGAGGVLVALPFLGAMDDSARAGSFPKRFVVFFTAFGQVKSAWTPTGTETNFTLGPALAPLAPHQADLLILEGIDMESSYHGPGDPHQQGIGHALTGTELQQGNLFPYVCNPAMMVGWGGGISVDQRIAAKVGQSTKFPSLELGVQVQYANVSSRMVYAGPAEPVPPEDDPQQAFTRIFGDLGADPASIKKRNERRAHVLDAVQDNTKALIQRLGAEDRHKLEEHLDAIAAIESGLDAPGALGGACAAPDIGEGGYDIYSNKLYPGIGKLQMDLLAMSLACDLTRVASIQWASTQAGKVFTWLGQSETHHTLSHSPDDDVARQSQLIAIGQWHSQQLAYLIDKLKSLPEGEGTVFDNTLILWCTDIAVGNTHARRGMPYVLAGSCGKALKTGRTLQYPGRYHNDLLVSILHAMDVPDVTFGNPAYCTGPLAGLTG